MKLRSIGKIIDSTSHPLWLVKRWVDQYGFEETNTMCELNLTPPMMTGRVNTTKMNRDECLEILRAEGFEVEASTLFQKQFFV